MAVLTVLVALALALIAVPAAQATPVPGVAFQSMTTGTVPFDTASPPGPGLDPSASDDQVRSYDTVQFHWTVNVNSDTGTTDTWNRIDLTQVLPAGMHFEAADIPLYCQGSGWSVSPDGQTLHCVYVPSGGSGNTGFAQNFDVIAHADGVPDDTVVTSAPDSTTMTVTYGATTSAPATATAPPIHVRAAPFVDMYKNNAVGSVAPPGDPNGPGYYITYNIGLQIPAARASSLGRRGSIAPNEPVTFVDNLAGISPNAAYQSCTSSLATFSCTPAGSTVNVSVTNIPADPTAGGQIATGKIRVFVPQGDVDASATPGSLLTNNALDLLDAEADDGHGGTVPATGDLLANNAFSYNLITTGGSGSVGFNKDFLDANGALLPTQAQAHDGNGQVLNTQIVQARLDINSASTTAPELTPAVCDVWDNTRLHLSTDGPGPAAHAGAAVWPDQIPGGWVEGVDYSIEYGTQATATGDDATRWTELRSRSACTDASDTWTTTLPADPSTVTKVRIMVLHDVPPAAPQIRFRVNFKVDDNTDGDIVANFLGTRSGATWQASTYNPALPGNNRSGDRVRTNGVTVRIRKHAISPFANFGTAVSLLSGNPIRFELVPLVTALDIGTGTPAAHNVVIRDRLPQGFTFDASQPTTPGGLAPVVTVDGSGRQILTWTIPTLTKGTEPTLTFWAKTAITAIGARVNEAVIDSDEDVGGLAAVPASPPVDQHYSNQTINLQSAGGVRISKAALQTVVEPLDPLAFRIEYANLTSSPVSNVDIIDVLPFAGDGVSSGGVPGRVPGSTRHGQAAIASIDITNGESIRYTDAAPTDIYPTSNPATTIDANYGVLPAGKSWCLPANFGTAGCPADLASATAFRLTRASMPSGDVADVVLHLAPTGNRSGDVYSNTSAIRYGSGNLGAISNVVTSRVVASSIGDYVWEDLNRNGVQDAGEPPIANMSITLAGTDKHGRHISVQTKTDDDGKYLFTSSSQAGQDAGVTDLVSGSYTVTFSRAGLPAGTSFTVQHAGTAGTDSDPDADGVAAVTLPDPSPSGADGQDLTIDAGVVRGVPSAPGKPEPPSSPPTDTPVTPPPSSPPHGPAPPKKTPKPTITVHGKPTKVIAGGKVTYKIVVGNTGTAAAHKTVVCDNPGKGLVVSSVSKGARFVHGQACWKIGTLDAGEHETMTITLRVAADHGDGRVRNVVALSAQGVKTRQVVKSVRVRASRRPATHVGVTG